MEICFSIRVQTVLFKFFKQTGKHPVSNHFCTLCSDYLNGDRLASQGSVFLLRGNISSSVSLQVIRSRSLLLSLSIWYRKIIRQILGKVGVLFEEGRFPDNKVTYLCNIMLQTRTHSAHILINSSNNVCLVMIHRQRIKCFPGSHSIGVGVFILRSHSITLLKGGRVLE